MPSPSLLALDFDGVLCNGLIEYFQTSWRAYCHLFDLGQMPPPHGLAERFYPLRPVIETGWEMPLLLHALMDGVDADVVWQDWPHLVRGLLKETGIAADQAMAAVDGVRDRWIQTDLPGWLSLHQFYPGMIARLQGAIAGGCYPIIISTKEGRFIQELLARQHVAISPAQILGKEVKQPKAETLRQLLAHPPIAIPDPLTIWFVEDRLQTLETVKTHPDLAAVELFLADWGYNTSLEKDAARRDRRIHLLSLSQFAQAFTNWQVLPDPPTASPEPSPAT